MAIGVIPIAIGREQARATTRARYARLALQASASCVLFLVIYPALQLLHALGRDPGAVKALSSIPLFARFLASASIAGVLGPIVGLIPGNPEQRLCQIPGSLAIALTLFFVVAIGFP
jgi:membrane associated rhomboid family serine protease